MDDLTGIARESPMVMQLMRAEGRRGQTGMFWQLSVEMQALLRRILSKVPPLSIVYPLFHTHTLYVVYVSSIRAEHVSCQVEASLRQKDEEAAPMVDDKEDEEQKTSYIPPPHSGRQTPTAFEEFLWNAEWFSPRHPVWRRVKRSLSFPVFLCLSVTPKRSLSLPLLLCLDLSLFLFQMSLSSSLSLSLCMQPIDTGTNLTKCRVRVDFMYFVNVLRPRCATKWHPR